MADVAEAIVDAAIEADVQAPEAPVVAIPVAIVAPVAGRPECTAVGCGTPRARNPVVTHGSPCPVAWSPDVVWLGSRWLLVHRQRRWRLAGIGVNGLVEVFVTCLIALAVLVALVVLVTLRWNVVFGFGRTPLDRRGILLCRLLIVLGLLIVPRLLLALIALTLAENACARLRCRRGGGRPGILRVWLRVLRVLRLVWIDRRHIDGRGIGSIADSGLRGVGIALAAGNGGETCQAEDRAKKKAVAGIMFEVEHGSYLLPAATAYLYMNTYTSNKMRLAVLVRQTR